MMWQFICEQAEEERNEGWEEESKEGWGGDAWLDAGVGPLCSELSSGAAVKLSPLKRA